MTDALEQELRAALAEQAATLPADAVERLATVDYTPRGRRLPKARRIWPFAGVTGAGVTAAIIAGVFLLSSGGGSLVPLAYAGWSATPHTPTASQIAHARDICRVFRAPLLETAMRGQLVLADRRGRYVALLYANGRSTGVCISDGSSIGTEAGATEARGSSTGHRATPSPDRVDPPSGGGGTAPDFPGSDGTAYHAWGRAGRNVTGVTLVFADHRTVQATVRHGWYFAWWPNITWPVAAEVTTSSGTRTSQIAGAWCLTHQRRCVFQMRPNVY